MQFSNLVNKQSQLIMSRQHSLHLSFLLKYEFYRAAGVLIGSLPMIFYTEFQFPNNIVPVIFDSFFSVSIQADDSIVDFAVVHLCQLLDWKESASDDLFLTSGYVFTQ